LNWNEAYLDFVSDQQEDIDIYFDEFLKMEESVFGEEDCNSGGEKSFSSNQRR
jgi:hypothetical protein